MEAFSGGRLASREVVDDVNDTTRVSDTARIYGRGESVTNWYGSLACVRSG